MDYAVNYLAILATGVAAVAIGWVWYSPMLFGNIWMKECGMGDMTPEKKAEGMKHMPKAVLGSFVAQLVLAYVMTYFAHSLGFTTSFEAINLAIWAWLGFTATMILHPVLWEGKSMTYYGINAGYSLVIFIVTALVVVLWV